MAATMTTQQIAGLQRDLKQTYAISKYITGSIPTLETFINADPSGLSITDVNNLYDFLDTTITTAQTTGHRNKAEQLEEMLNYFDISKLSDAIDTTALNSVSLLGETAAVPESLAVAVNNLGAAIGNATLTTEAKTLSGAINELASDLGAMTGTEGTSTSIGILSDLTTTAKNSLVAAVNEINSNGWVTSAKILDGTIATADLADGSVTSAKIADGTIATADLATFSVTTAKLANDSVNGPKIAMGAVTTVAIFDGTITNNDINATAAIAYSKLSLSGSIVAGDLTTGAVTSAKILDGTITTSDLSDGSVTSAKIVDGAITVDKIANTAISVDKIGINAVTTDKIADGAVTIIKIGSGAVITAKIADSAVTTAKIADASVTSAKIADGTIVNADISGSAAITYSKLSLTGSVVAGDLADSSVTSAKILNGTIATEDLADGAVTTGKIASNAVLRGQIMDSSVNSVKIESGAVTSAKIADGAVTTAKIADGAITGGPTILTLGVPASKIAANTITSNNMAIGSITSAAILDGTIATEDLANGAVTSAKIADGTIATADLAGSSITSEKIADGSVTSAKILDGTIATADLADSSVTSAKIANGSIITEDLADVSVTSAKIADGTIAYAKLNLADGDIPITKVADIGTLSSLTTRVTSNVVSAANGLQTDIDIITNTLGSADITFIINNLTNALSATSVSTPGELAELIVNTVGAASPTLTISNLTTLISASLIYGNGYPNSISGIIAAAINNLNAVTSDKTCLYYNGATAIFGRALFDGSCGGVNRVIYSANVEVDGHRLRDDANVLKGITPLGSTAPTTISGALGAFNTAIGTSSLTTTAQTLSGAVNEINANGWVTSTKILDGTIATADLADGSVTSAKILDGTIATEDLADASVTSAKILDGTIATEDLADGSVTSGKIADGTIVTADLADASVTSSKISDGTIPYAKLNLADGDIPIGKVSGIGTLSSLTTRVTSNVVNAANGLQTDVDIITNTLGSADISFIINNLTNALSATSVSTAEDLATLIVNTVGADSPRLTISDLTTLISASLSHGNSYPDSISGIIAAAINNLNAVTSDKNCLNNYGATTLFGRAIFEGFCGGSNLVIYSNNVQSDGYLLRDDANMLKGIVPLGATAPTTISGALGAFNTAIGTSSLTTTAQTLSGAINEINSHLDIAHFKAGVSISYDDAGACSGGSAVSLVSVGYVEGDYVSQQNLHHISMLCGKCSAPIICSDYFITWS